MFEEGNKNSNSHNSIQPCLKLNMFLLRSSSSGSCAPMHESHQACSAACSNPKRSSPRGNAGSDHLREKSRFAKLLNLSILSNFKFKYLETNRAFKICTSLHNDTKSAAAPPRCAVAECGHFVFVLDHHGHGNESTRDPALLDCAIPQTQPSTSAGKIIALLIAITGANSSGSTALL